YLTSDPINADLTTISSVKLFGLIGMLLALSAGRISDFIGVKRIILISLITAGISLILMGVTHNLIIITLFSVIFIAGISFVIPS
ncbi:hypothetical protein NL500_30220, partial [Klebsiella pneumoniae]|nr:hypothetical protein [Klebsiella pneumoniae]